MSNILGQKRLDNNSHYYSKNFEWQKAQDDVISKNAKAFTDFVEQRYDGLETNFYELQKVVDNIIDVNGITIDTTLDVDSTNAIANKTVAEKFNDIEDEIKNLDNVTATGVVYQDGTTYEGVELTADPDTSTVATFEIDCKCIPISVYPQDPSATWRFYHIKNWVYNAETGTTKITIVATDTGTPINVTVLKIVENEG